MSPKLNEPLPHIHEDIFYVPVIVLLYHAGFLSHMC